jgi:peroxiredoxin
MRRRNRLAAAFVIGVALIAAAGVLGVRAFRASRAPRAAEVAACPANARKANLDLDMKDTNGRVVHLADYSGKVLVLDFWATWCVPCQVELPGFVDIAAKYKDRGAAVVGVVVLDEFKNAKPYAEAHGMTYPILDGVDREDVEKAFGPMMGLPTSFVISRDGRICAAHLGVPDIEHSTGTLEQSIEYVFTSEIDRLL